MKNVSVFFIMFNFCHHSICSDNKSLEKWTLPRTTPTLAAYQQELQNRVRNITEQEVDRFIGKATFHIILKEVNRKIDDKSWFDEAMLHLHFAAKTTKDKKQFRYLNRKIKELMK